MSGDSEFVNIAEAARQLGIDPRQVRRYLPRLAPTDKATDTQRTHKGRPVVLVRLSAVEALRDAGRERETATDTGNGQDRTSQRTGQDTSDALLAELRARLQDREAEVVYLREALCREQETARAALSDLAEERGRAAEGEGSPGWRRE